VFGPVGEDRVGAARRASAELGCTVLLKGDRTVVADTAGMDTAGVYVNPTGSAVLATAGSGDVLSGLAGSLLASPGMSAVHAATAAAFVHGLAGRLAATDGPVSATAVCAALRSAVRTVLGDF
jgi:NAD(P)H-hydrate repair Nnr-like enzyme with NAD(P)H-hydrate dehydratase domain